MTNIHQQFPKNTTWEDLSERLVRHYRLPHGSAFALRNKDGRIVRKDRKFSRKPLRASEHPIDDGVNVAEVCSRAASMLAINLRQLDWAIVAFGPGDSEIRGRTLLKTWREMQPTPTDDEKEQKAIRLTEIDEFLKPRALAALEELDEGIDDPENKVPQAMIAALIRRYDVGDVRRALEELRV